ncbi:MAG: sialate O-acetylesterase [Tidjanibacter sp.]|nr:sialate O-acetylesterase [Tidjanibacter sp.]
MKRLLMNNVAMLVAVAFCVLTLGACGESGTGNEGGGETPTPEEQIPTSGCDVYLFLGQSNMSGFGGEMIEGDDEPIPNVYLLDNNGELRPAAAPMNFFSSVRKRMDLQKVNPAFQFSKVMSEKSKNPVVIVCNARGGTSMSEWQKKALPIYFGSPGDDPWLWGFGAQLYGEAVRRCKEAMKYGELKAILWHQGCSDSQPGAAAAYLGRLKTFVTDLRADLGVGSEVPFIAGELQYKSPGAPNFNPVIRRIGEEIEGAYWVSAEGVTICGDGIHFDRPGNILIGGRYVDKVLELLDVEKEEE